MKRRLFRLLSALSLLLCVGTCVLWARSYWRSDGIWITTDVDNRELQQYGSHWYKGYTAETAFGQVRFQVQWNLSVYPSTPATWSIRWTSDEHVGFEGQSGGGTHTQARYRFSLWRPALAAGVTPGIFVMTRRRRRQNPGHSFCLRCGYDLRATPDRCPECGTVPTAPK
jgi:hypothetical protein